MLCDNDTGVCTAPLVDEATVANKRPGTDAEVIYVGDPMCSWCWGIEPALRRIQHHCEERGLGFSIVLGGLRPGGGDPWNADFKAFLRHHWAEIAAVSGQPFSFGLLDLEHFSYDTEPACRAVATARHMLGSEGQSRRLYAIFSAIQRKFYMDGDDPTRVGFYEDIMVAASLEFSRFADLFSSDDAREATRGDFALCRSWGVRSFPTLLAKVDNRVVRVATGFVTAEAVIDKVDAVLRT